VLPGMSGMQLIEWLRIDRGMLDLTLVVHSGNVDQVSREAELRYGIAEFFVKGDYAAPEVQERLAKALMIDGA